MAKHGVYLKLHLYICEVKRLFNKNPHIMNKALIDAYQNLTDGIAKQISDLQNKLKIHQANFNQSHNNWGYVGDLGNIANDLFQLNDGFNPELEITENIRTLVEKFFNSMNGCTKQEMEKWCNNLNLDQHSTNDLILKILLQARPTCSSDSNPEIWNTWTNDSE